MGATTSRYATLFRSSFYGYLQDESKLNVGLISEEVKDAELKAADKKNKKTNKTKLNKSWFKKLLNANIYMFSIRGYDNIHIYVWILKDYAWSSDNKTMGLIFGTIALAWTLVLEIVAYNGQDWEEMYFLVTMFLWLFSNFWWMIPEVGIYGDDDGNAEQTSYMMYTALAMLVLFFTVIKPMGLIKENKEITEQFEKGGLFPRFNCFANWRQYEYIHMMCWLCKDLCWNRGTWMETDSAWPTIWYFALVPTILIGFDFMYETWRKNFIVDFAHYTAQLLWVIANAAWAYGEMNTSYDDAFPVTDTSHTALMTGRWWASVLLLASFAPIVILYFVWLPWVLINAIKEREQNSIIKRNPSNQSIEEDDNEDAEDEDEFCSSDDDDDDGDDGDDNIGIVQRDANESPVILSSIPDADINKLTHTRASVRETMAGEVRPSTVEC
jgi:hypothetical protein